MEHCEILVLSKRILGEGGNRLSLSLGHGFRRLSMLAISPDGPKGAQVTIDPDDRVMEFIRVPPINQRLAHHRGFTGPLRKGTSQLTYAMGRSARIFDLQAAKVHEHEAIDGECLLDRGPWIVTYRP